MPVRWLNSVDGAFGDAAVGEKRPVLLEFRCPSYLGVL